MCPGLCTSVLAAGSPWTALQDFWVGGDGDDGRCRFGGVTMTPFAEACGASQASRTRGKSGSFVGFGWDFEWRGGSSTMLFYYMLYYTITNIITTTITITTDGFFWLTGRFCERVSRDRAPKRRVLTTI